MWKYYALFSAFFAALTTILVKIGISGVSGNIATAIRTIVILVIASGIVVATGEHRQIINISKRSLLFIILSGGATGLSWLFYFKALETGLATKVAVIDKSSLALTLILAFILLREPISLEVVIGCIFIIAGTLIVMK
ncbi:EamA family transporter [Runella salmonicolor]|uniref:EamA family transporter n=1 Tax=Runella salmonicolor TaxID=2950278 RepID=A0ABT1FX52_9BACT|nr:EamA family transporter [Runella salmonicolor]MCP1386350.1 EamA family transporter [Runella salmonicolor]